ncbi:protein HokA [Escherichia coli UMEA 3108-1]|nr:protein HokA [Escherichia coli UMEA 3108-1]EQZ87066.1 protein HokA [Escherichia coli UMEA 3703-1]GCW57358.1 cell killing protein [Escherichia coli]
MPEHHKVSLLLVGNQHRRLGCRRNMKYRLLSLIVICFTLLFFTWMIRDSLCELHIKQENYELAAFLACKLKE